MTVNVRRWDIIDMSTSCRPRNERNLSAQNYAAEKALGRKIGKYFYRYIPAAFAESSWKKEGQLRLPLERPPFHQKSF
jgi:hypothetical protein